MREWLIVTSEMNVRYWPKADMGPPPSLGAGLMVLDSPHKDITDTAYQASVAESSVVLPPE